MKLAGKLFRRGAKDREAYGADEDPNDLDDFDRDRQLDLETMTLDDLDVPGRDRVSVLGEDDDSDGAGRGGRRVRPALVVALVVVMLIAVGVQGYSILFGGSSDGEVPVVRAADDPVKVKPDAPGGLEVPYQDQLVMNQPAEGAEGDGTAVERLLPPPEAPQPPQSAAEQSVATSELATRAAQPAASPQSPGVTDERSELDSAPTVAETQAAAPAVVEAPASETKVPDTQAQAPQVPKTQAPKAPAPETQAAKAPAPETQAATRQQAAIPAEQPVAAPGDGRFFIQLLSLTSKDGTAASWGKLQKAHPEQLGGSALFVQEAKVNGRTYYRVQAGRFATRDAANTICGQLKARKQDCLVLQR